MKVTFPLPTDGRMHRYCLSCNADGVARIKHDGIITYHCETCGEDNERALYFDKHKCWLDDQQQLWHESAVVFVRRKDGKYLFYLRTEFPFKLTIPSGHVDIGEDPETSAKRELQEETGLTGKLSAVGDSDVDGDSCSAGADNHRLHAFLLEFDDSDDNVRIFEEGDKPLWLTLEDAKSQGMAFVAEAATSILGERAQQ